MNKGGSLATIAVYSLKGGVGKTTFAVNLAWAAHKLSARRTLVWDLDAQAATSWLLSADHKGRDEAQAIFTKDIDAKSLIRPTTVPGLDLIAADTSLRSLDLLFREIGKKKRLTRLIEGLEKDYERIILDCPPGLTETSEQVLRAADIIVMPVIPSPLSQRALEDVTTHLNQHGGHHGKILPVYSMVDKRRSLHRAALEEHPDWPVISMASAVEQMTARRLPLGEFASRSATAQQFSQLWQQVERLLSQR